MVTKAEEKLNNCLIFIPNECAAFHAKIFWQKVTTKADSVDFNRFQGYYIGLLDGVFAPYSRDVKNLDIVKILTLNEAYKLFESK